MPCASASRRAGFSERLDPTPLSQCRMLLQRLLSTRRVASSRPLLLPTHAAVAVATAPVVAVRRASSTSSPQQPLPRRRPPSPFVSLRPLSKRIRAKMAQANTSAVDRMRANMENNKIAAFVVPTADAHQVSRDRNRSGQSQSDRSAGSALSSHPFFVFFVVRVFLCRASTCPMPTSVARF